MVRSRSFLAVRVQIRCFQALKPDGVFLAAMLGGETLQELRSACRCCAQCANGEKQFSAGRCRYGTNWRGFSAHFPVRAWKVCVVRLPVELHSHTSVLLLRDCAELLSGAGFALPTVDADVITARYPDMFTLVDHLQNMGENNAVLNRGPAV